ncbi:acetate--CoA ligase family protein [Thiomonas sp. FB-Cd]|uniref:acetate--CoA ligase family protein n=1 Tax=Thiomonas sp. FB-Cd TaxID=1158292 RepID=UPI0004DF303B|nr:acetate--CoA ligase [Thiomonas sp. FB-Cd]
MTNWAQATFSPRRIALIGASAEAGKAGRLLWDNLSAATSVEVVPIHPQVAHILGSRAYPCVADVPDPVDLAVIVTPAASVPAILEDCVRAGVITALVLSGGFAETGHDGATLQAKALAVAQAGGMRLIGPNCFGLLNTRCALNASLAMGLPKTGGVSLFTQSGSYGMAAFSRSQEGAIGFSKVLSAGNKADINELDALGVFGEDVHTRVIALVLESIADGPGLVRALRAITPSKPVVILKTGRTPGGARATSSHTAALAQSYGVIHAALTQAGAIMVDDGMTLFDVAAALDMQPPWKGNRVAIVTNSGGTGAELTDLCEAQGLQVPALSPSLQAAVAKHLPPHGSALNPVDVTTAWPRFAQMYGQSLRALLASDEIDAVVPVLLQRSALDMAVADAIIAETRQAQALGTSKPVHVCWVAPAEGAAVRSKLLAAGIPCHEWAARAARVLALCGERTAPMAPSLEAGALAQRHAPQADGWLAPEHAFGELELWGMPVAAWRLAHDAGDAASAAHAVGMPCVLKAIRPGLLHKSEAHAVHLGLRDASSVQACFQALESRLGPGPILVQAQAQPGIEIILGGIRDATFGPLVVIGLGGVWTEILADVQMALAPLSPEAAHQAIQRLRGARALEGYRGAKAVDIQALARLVSAFSQMFARAPWCLEVDVNPLLASGDRFLVVDARMRTKGMET